MMTKDDSIQACLSDLGAARVAIIRAAGWIANLDDFALEWEGMNNPHREIRIMQERVTARIDKVTIEAQDPGPNHD